MQLDIIQEVVLCKGRFLGNLNGDLSWADGLPAGVNEPILFSPIKEAFDSEDYDFTICIPERFQKKL